MHCTSCHAALDPMARFCPSCGAATGTSMGILPKQVTEERSEGVLGRIVGEMRRTPLEWFVPLRAWAADRFWTVVWVKWFLFFAVFPLALLQFFAEVGGRENDSISMLALYFGLLWVFLLRACLNPERVDRFLIAKVAGFTAVFGVVLVLVIAELPIAHEIYGKVESASTFARLCGFVLGVGLVEESVKALPIFLFLYRGPQRWSPLAFAYVGALSGLAFGVSEAVMYSIGYARDNNVGSMPAQVYILIQVLRFVTLPLLHASWTGIAAVFMGAALQRRESAHALIAFGLALATVLHGVYDAFPGLASLGVAALSFVLFVAYARGRGRATRAAEPLASEAQTVVSSLPRNGADATEALTASFER